MEHYKTVKRDGMQAVILNRGRILLLKRINLPFISNPGDWSFVGGGRKRNEDYIETALREIREETGFRKEDLKLLRGNHSVFIADPKRNLKWLNKFFVFSTGHRRIKLNFENSRYKWASYAELTQEKSLMDALYSREKILRIIRSCNDGST